MLMLLWEEYATGNPLPYKYTRLCIKCRFLVRGCEIQVLVYNAVPYRGHQMHSALRGTTKPRPFARANIKSKSESGPN